MQFFTKTFVILATLTVPTALRAGDIPNYPPERWCKEVSDVSGGSDVIYGGCMDQEQDAYDALKQSWTDVPSKTQAWCKEVAKSSGSGSYVILKGCIDQETAAREKNSTRQFKR